MPSENATLERIQQEISEVVQREKELKRLHSEQYVHYHHGDTDTESSFGSENGDLKHDDYHPGPMKRSQSTSVLSNGSLYQNGYSKQFNWPSKGSNNNVFRLFAPNPQARGVMQRFIKSRGKINSITAITNGSNNNLSNATNGNAANRKSWALPEMETTKVTIDPSKCVRRGFVPVEERMRKEFQEMHVRELELKKERTKSQSDLMDDFDDDSSSLDMPLRSAKSMAHLNSISSSESEEVVSAPGSLKPARSLAELVDVDDLTELPTSSNLISKFETIIKKNQARP